MSSLSKKTALNLLAGLLCLVLLFHLGVLFEIIPYSIVWAGKINSLDEMRVFELISISVNVFLLKILSIKRKNLIANKRNKVIDIIIWVFVILFALNTLGNLFAQSWIELIFGTALTFVSSILSYLIVRKPRRRTTTTKIKA